MHLLQGEELSGIGVAELCREAGVHRTTFYGHYESVGELAADVFASMIDEASAVDPVNDQPLHVIARVYYDGTASVLRAVARERQAIRSLLESSVSLGFRRRLRTYFVKRAAEAIEVMRANGLDLPQNTDVGTAFIAGGLVSSLELWASVDDDDVETFTRRVFRNMPGWWPDLQE